VIAAPGYGIELPDRELACAPIHSPVGQAYLGAMRAAVNCALANRQVITHLTRKVFGDVLREPTSPSSTTCRTTPAKRSGTRSTASRAACLCTARARRAPSAPVIRRCPVICATSGQPVLIGGSMGTASYILVGTEEGRTRAFSSACHGAGRAMSRHQATRQWHGRALVDELASQGILIRSPSLRGVAEEAPGAYKDVSAVVEAADRAGLARKVAKLKPLVCIKG